MQQWPPIFRTRVQGMLLHQTEVSTMAKRGNYTTACKHQNSLVTNHMLQHIT